MTAYRTVILILAALGMTGLLSAEAMADDRWRGDRKAGGYGQQFGHDAGQAHGRYGSDRYGSGRYAVPDRYRPGHDRRDRHDRHDGPSPRGLRVADDLSDISGDIDRLRGLRNGDARAAQGAHIERRLDILEGRNNRERGHLARRNTAEIAELRRKLDRSVRDGNGYRPRSRDDHRPHWRGGDGRSRYEDHSGGLGISITGDGVRIIVD